MEVMMADIERHPFSKYQDPPLQFLMRLNMQEGGAGKLVHYRCYQIAQTKPEITYGILPTCHQVKLLNRYLKLLPIELKYYLNFIKIFA